MQFQDFFPILVFFSLAAFLSFIYPLCKGWFGERWDVGHKTDSAAPSSHQFPVAPQLEMELRGFFPIHVKILVGLMS